MSESIDFPKLKVIYLKERFLKKYLTDVLKNSTDKQTN